MADHHPPSTTCWQLWTVMVHTINFGSSKGMHLYNPLGDWMPHHSAHCFWQWHMHGPTHIVFRHSPTLTTQMPIPVLQHLTIIKFSPTVPTQLPFDGPSVTL